MKIIIAIVGKSKKREIKSLIDAYLKRMGAYAQIEIKHVQEGKGSPSEVKKSETNRLLEVKKSIKSRQIFQIALDEKGKLLTSIGLSKRFQHLMNTGRSTWIFYIGGAYGHDSRLLKECDWTWALSTLTFPHELALLLTVEQIYRGFSILAHSPYHKN